jgi:hypothetical protein
MDKANKKNGFIESYTINFVGNLVQLKDKFKADKLNSLVNDEGVSYYDQLNFTYDLLNVGSRIEPTTTAAVYFPLIGSTRRFEYNTGVAANDITLLTGAIDFTELFPSINVSVILSYIQQAYGIEFTGEFLNSQTFTKLHLYCKNAEVMSCKTQLDRITFRLLPELTERFTIPFFYVPTFTMTVSPFNTLPVFRQNIILNITTTCTNYNLYVYNNGELYFSNLNLNGNHQQLVIVKQGFFADTFNFEFFINSDLPVSFDYSATLANNYQLLTGANPPYVVSSKNYNSLPVVQTSTALLSIKNYMPDITVNDFLTALVKMFNIVIEPISENTFEFTPLEKWYQDGNIIDITKFIQSNELEIGKPKLFKKIDFKHEESQNILNNFFKNLNNNQEYGNLFYDNENSAFTDNYEIKTPFENVIWERTTGSDFLTATMWDKDRNPYTPKPILLYDNSGIYFGDVTTDYIYLKDATTNLHLDSYRRFSNEIQLGASDLTYLQTLNWGSENSVWNLTAAPNGLYQQFYSNYINNLYNQRTRVIKAKGFFTPYLLSSLKLNDRVVVSNKRYIINTLTTDLTTGEVELELLNDFRDITQDTTYFRFSNIPFLQVDNTEQEVEFIIYKNNYDTFDVKLSTDFLNYTLSTDNDTDILLDVTIPANTTAADRSDFVILEYFENGVGTIIQIPVLQYA